MERLYRLFPWVEDPFTAEGLSRYRAAVSEFKTVVTHGWFRELISGRRELRLVDLCSGAGIGGVALAKVLTDSRVKVGLTLVDLRRDALGKAAEFRLRELGSKPEVLVGDVLELGGPGLERSFDIALIWGLTTPHFSPWEWVRVLANVSRLLVEGGLFAYDEADRVYSVFYLVGYKDVLPELVEGDRVVLSVHKGRDFRTGYFSRAVLNILSGEREEMRVYFWDIASSATLTWVFFSDVDYLPTRRPHSGVVLARKPRRSVNLEAAFKEVPAMLKHQ